MILGAGDPVQIGKREEVRGPAVRLDRLEIFGMIELRRLARRRAERLEDDASAVVKNRERVADESLQIVPRTADPHEAADPFVRQLELLFLKVSSRPCVCLYV